LQGSRGTGSRGIGDGEMGGMGRWGRWGRWGSRNSAISQQP
jgi:hypothetical protein